MPEQLNDFADWQWNVNPWSKQDNPAAAVNHYLARGEHAFAWLCYGQRDDSDALRALHLRRDEVGDGPLFVDILTAHGRRQPDLAEAAVHLEWQAHSNPRSLVDAMGVWRGPAEAAGKPPIAAMFNLLSGQQYNPNACQVYRACFAHSSDELFEIIESLTAKFVVGELMHPYLLGDRPSATVLRDRVPNAGAVDSS